MTDSQPPKATPARRTAPKTTAATTPAAKAPAAKPAAAKTTAAKAPAAKATPAAKAPAAKTPAAKAPAAKTPATKPAAAKPATTRSTAAKAKADAAAAPAAATLAPVEPTPATAATATAATVATPAATAPAGWYPVSAGSATQRYWDGSAWTEHIHDPAAVAAAAASATSTTAPAAASHHQHLRAPEGTSATTVWFWLTVGSMAISIAYWIVTAVYWSRLVNVNLDYEAAAANPWADPTFIASFVLGFVSTVAFIVFPILDWAQLRKRGVPKPFHWAWSLFALPLGTPVVYVIGRVVVAKRRTGKGLAPLWVFIALQVVTWIVAIVAIVLFFIGLATGFLGLFNDAGEIL